MSRAPRVVVRVATTGAGGAYRSVVQLRHKNVLRPMLLPRIAIRVADVFSAGAPKG